MSKDYRIEEFTLRINEAKHYFKMAVKQHDKLISNQMKLNIRRMKQQRAEIIAGRV